MDTLHTWFRAYQSDTSVTASTATSVMSQLLRLSAVRFVHFEATAITTASSTVCRHWLSSTDLRSFRAARVASQKALLTCAFKKSCSNGFPSDSASRRRSPGSR